MPKAKAKKKVAVKKRNILSLHKQNTSRKRPNFKNRDPRSPTSIMSLGANNNNNNNNQAGHQNECSLIKSACRHHKWSDGRKQPDSSGKYKKCYYAISRGNWSPPHEQNKYYAHPDKGGDIEANQRLNRCIGQESDYGLNSDFVEDEGGELHDGKGISKEERDERKAEFFATIKARNQNISDEILERLWEEHNSKIRIGRNQNVRFSGTRKKRGEGRKRKTRKKVRKRRRRRRRKKIKTKKRRKRIRKTKKRR